MAAVAQPVIVNEQIELEALAVIEKAKAVVVTNQQEFETAVAIGREVATRIDAVVEFFAPMKIAANKAHKAICEKEKAVVGPLDQARRQLAEAASRWQLAQERLREEEENRLRAKAQREEEDRRLAEAAQLEKEGRREEATQVLEQESVPLPVVAPSTVTKVRGFTSRGSFKARVTNLGDLVRAVAAGRVPLAALQVDDTVLQQQARSLGKQLNWPGIEVYPVASGSFRK